MPLQISAALLQPSVVMWSLKLSECVIIVVQNIVMDIDKSTIVSASLFAVIINMGFNASLAERAIFGI
ncbi:hypothetical protein [Buttiauxella sp. JUb87]|uniref:hypothetical protein n=1 Tax=Buttiauxella sp. JUb87 TaxID=2485129 RepID=UPI00105D0261|nr:hypothetical protein [Buttiauxella sp. JUb87]